MKRLVLVLFVLSLGAMLLPVPTPAQDVDVRVQVKSPPRSYAPVAVRPVYADAPPPPPVLLPAGSGCYGTHAAGGCFGSAGGSCHGTPRRTIAQITYEVELRQKAAPELLYALGGCQGRAGGACYGSGCYGSAAFAGVGYAAPYGSRLPGGVYATPSGDPPPPEILPFNGPITRGFRRAFGYDPNPAPRR